MNKIQLKGILKNIEYSHTINDIEFYKANLIVKRDNTNKEDIISLKFKRFSNPYKENEEVSLVGNVRTYNHITENKNKVELYVFTYFDKPDDDITNKVELDGRICKKGELRKTQVGKDVLDFVLANNLQADTQILNVYPPCVVWGKCAKALNKLNVGDRISIVGQLQSREYKKKISEDDFEIRICHELNVVTFDKVER